MNREQAEHRLRKLEEKLRIDAARGDSDAAADDARRIGYLRYRIAVDVWLIRKFAMQDPGCYPLVIDESSLAYLAQAARPAPEPDFPQIMPRPLPVPAPTVSVVIANAETKGDPVPFTIDGITHMAAPGSLEKYDVVPGAFITFESGASVGERRYQLVPGVFEFRSTPHGWELYTVSDKP